jgi:3-methyladenine DNA glycosylase AlkC
MKTARIPSAPKSIQKGVPLKDLLDGAAIDCLAHNVSLVYGDFDVHAFSCDARKDLEPLGLMDRGRQLANTLHQHLPNHYQSAIDILLASLTPPLEESADNGLEVMFYLPHVIFVAEFGLDPSYNTGIDPFEASMQAQYQLTKRFSAEFSMRPFLIEQQQRTLEQLHVWASDPDPHVRRLCSEGSRPRLPWAKRIPAFIKDPSPVIPLLESLRDDSSLYVRRSVANHLGDIAKDHLDLVFEICERWLKGASNDTRWMIRHALRHPAKKGHKHALQIRTQAKALKT